MFYPQWPFALYDDDDTIRICPKLVCSKALINQHKLLHGIVLDTKLSLGHCKEHLNQYIRLH